MVGDYENTVYDDRTPHFASDDVMGRGATFTPEGEGLAGEGWNIKPGLIAAICTEFSEALKLTHESLGPTQT